MKKAILPSAKKIVATGGTEAQKLDLYFSVIQCLCGKPIPRRGNKKIILLSAKKGIATEAQKHGNPICIFLCFSASVAN